MAQRQNLDYLAGSDPSNPRSIEQWDETWGEMGEDERREAARRRDSVQATLLMRAAGANNVPVMRELLAYGAKVEASDSRGERAVHYSAISAKGTESLQLLIEYGADLHACTFEDQTPLMAIFTSQIHSAEVAEAKCALLLAAGCSTGLTPSERARTLSFAERFGHQPCIEMLKEAEAADSSPSAAGFRSGTTGGTERFAAT